MEDRSKELDMRAKKGKLRLFRLYRASKGCVIDKEASRELV